jgi:predicted transcriptional regulator
MQYRSRTEIISVILGVVVNGGAKKTRIMYDSYLSYRHVEAYLDLLSRRNLIQFDQSTRLYTLTDKGMEFLRASSEIQQLMPGNLQGGLV